MGPERYDVCVLGLGAMGAATLLALSQRGVRAVGVERFPIAHDRGSSHGDTRIIRRAYFEAPDYLPLLDRAYAGWRAIEQAAGEALLCEAGLLVAGLESSPTIRGLVHSYAAFPVEHERIDAAEARRRYPMLAIPDGLSCFIDREGGFVYAERSVAAMVRLARAAGATVHAEEPAESWQSDAAGVRVRTARRSIEASRLVVTAGPWAARELADLGVPLEVVRKVLFWYEARDAQAHAPSRMPCWFVDTRGVAGFEGLEGEVYGFPAISALGVKAAEHSTGASGEAAKAVSDPLAVDRALHPADEARVRAMVAKLVPGVRSASAGGAPVRTRHAVCMRSGAHAPRGVHVHQHPRRTLHPGRPPYAPQRHRWRRLQRARLQDGAGDRRGARRPCARGVDRIPHRVPRPLALRVAGPSRLGYDAAHGAYAAPSSEPPMQDPMKKLTHELAKVEEGQLKAFADKGRVILMIQDAPEELRRLADALEKVNISEIQAMIAYKLPEPAKPRSPSAKKASPRPAPKGPPPA